MLFGAHESIGGGIHKAASRALDDGCRPFQIFTHSPSVWKTPAIPPSDLEQFQAIRQKHNLGPVLVHDSYLINPCAEKPRVRNKSWPALREEAQRCDEIGAEFLVLHPGSPGNMGEDEGISLVAACLEEALAGSQSVCFLLETTAGQGKSIGHRFEHLARVIEQCGGNQRLGVCFDTCHSFAAGYDLRSTGAARDTFEEFDRVVGLDRLRAFHLNDSKKTLGSRVDRHETTGDGEIGLDFFRWLANHPPFAKIPGILETPKEKSETYRSEITLLNSLCVTPG